MNIDLIEKNIRREAERVFVRIMLFLGYYFALILAVVALTAVALVLTWHFFPCQSGTGHADSRLQVIGVVSTLVILTLGIRSVWYMIKPMFLLHDNSSESETEVGQNDCPELFSIIQDVAKATGNRMPAHVYLTTGTGASVSYKSMSIWSLFLPVRRKLTFGLGLLHGTNRDEVRAVIAHEFGHFSQIGANLATVSARMMFVIGSIIERVEMELQIEACNRSYSDSFFGNICNPVTFVRRWTVEFYHKFVQRKYCSLLRLSEVEADIMACRIAGARPFISSMCKMSALTDRAEVYEYLMNKLISEKRKLKSYREGYRFIDSYLSAYGYEAPSCREVLSAMSADETVCRSRVFVQDSWETHPPVEERIRNAAQFLAEQKSVDLTDAETLVPDNIADRVAEVMHKNIARYLETPVKWFLVEEMKPEDMKEWTDNLLSSTMVSRFLKPFMDRDFEIFEVPSDEESGMPVESPFTIPNRVMLLEYSQAVADWNTLMRLEKQNENRHLIYDGEPVRSVAEAIEKHRSYLYSFNNRLAALDGQIYRYLWQRTRNRTDLKNTYWILFFGLDSRQKLSEMKHIADLVRAESCPPVYHPDMGIYKAYDGPSLSAAVKEKLVNDFWKYMRSYDYEELLRHCASHQLNLDKKLTVAQLVDRWRGFSAEESVPAVSGSAYVYGMIDEVYYLADSLYYLGIDQLIEWVKKACNGVEDNTHLPAYIERTMLDNKNSGMLVN